MAHARCMLDKYMLHERTHMHTPTRSGTHTPTHAHTHAQAYKHPRERINREICNKFCIFRQQLFHESSLKLRYTYIAYLVSLCN